MCTYYGYDEQICDQQTTSKVCAISLFDLQVKFITVCSDVSLLTHFANAFEGI